MSMPDFPPLCTPFVRSVSQRSCKYHSEDLRRDLARELNPDLRSGRSNHHNAELICIEEFELCCHLQKYRAPSEMGNLVILVSSLLLHLFIGILTSFSHYKTNILLLV